MSPENEMYLESCRQRILSSGDLPAEDMARCLDILHAGAVEGMNQAFTKRPQTTTRSGRKGAPAQMTLDQLGEMLGL